MPLPPHTEVYRALLRDSKPSIDNFRLRPQTEKRPAEDSLSIALTELKARDYLNCKGYAVLTVEGIEAIQGLTVQQKRQELQPDPNNPDEELLEVMGLPLAADDPTRILDIAQAVIRAVVRSESFPKPIKLEPPEQEIPAVQG